MGDALYHKYPVHHLAAHITGELTERSFRFHSVGGNFSLNDDLCGRRHFQIYALALDQRERLAADAAGDGIFIAVVTDLGHAGQAHSGAAAEHDRRRQRNLSLFAFVKVNADMLRRWNAHAGSIRPFDHAAIGTDIGNTGIKVFRDHIGSGQKRSAVEPGVADGHGKTEQAAAGPR